MAGLGRLSMTDGGKLGEVVDGWAKLGHDTIAMDGKKCFVGVYGAKYGHDDALTNGGERLVFGVSGRSPAPSSGF